MAVELIEDATFAEGALSAAALVVVDFFTTWCGPCKILSPTLEELSEELGDTVQFFKLDAEQSPETTKRFDVKGYPTVVMLKDGEEVGRFSGSWPRREVRNRINACRGIAVPERTTSDPAVTVPPAVDRLVEAIARLTAEQWQSLHADLDAPAEPHPPAVDLTAQISWVSNEVDDLAASHFGDDVTLAVTSAAVPAFTGWLDPSAANPAQLIAAAPITGHVKALWGDRSPVAFVAALRSLTDAQWSEIGRQVMLGTTATNGVYQLGQDSGLMTDTWRAWFAAASLARAIATRSILDKDLYDAAWRPFIDLLDRQSIEAAGA